MFISSSSGHRLLIHRHPERSSSLALTIGNFDGVHRGHQAMLRQLQLSAHRRNLQTAVLLFHPHPRFFFQPHHFREAWCLRDKILYFCHFGIDHLYIIRFNSVFSRYSADFFVEDFLIHRLNVKYLLVGRDFSFGAHRRGHADLLAAYAARGLFELCVFPDVPADDNDRVSSTLLRRALAEHRFDRARHLLGYPYQLSGRVRRGRQLGRTLGFPTINIRPPHHPIVQGTFVALVHGIGDRPRPAVAHMGLRPSVGAEGQSCELEAHIFDFSGDIYGRCVSVEFLKHLHDERRYASLDLLRSGIQQDCQEARAYFSSSDF